MTLMWRRKQAAYDWPPEFSVLANYNAEVARGIMHTPEWEAQMAEVQERYEVWAREQTQGQWEAAVRR